MTTPVLIRVVIADDEPVALRGLRSMLAAVPAVEIVGEARTGDEALTMITGSAPELAILDIRMPGLSGLTVAARLGAQPASGGAAPEIVFLSAYDRYAADAFAVEATDYLLKPVRPERLREAVERARRRRTERAAARGPTENPLTTADILTRPALQVPDRHGDVAVPLDELVWIEAAKDYALLHTRTRTHILRITMAELPSRLSADFLRVHRSAVVSWPMMRRVIFDLKGAITLLLADGTEVQVGPSYAQTVRARWRNGGNLS